MRKLGLLFLGVIIFAALLAAAYLFAEEEESSEALETVPFRIPGSDPTATDPGELNGDLDQIEPARNGVLIVGVPQVLVLGILALMSSFASPAITIDRPTGDGRRVIPGICGDTITELRNTLSTNASLGGSGSSCLVFSVLTPA